MDWRAPFIRWIAIVGIVALASAYALLLSDDERDPRTAQLLEKRRAATTDLPFAIYALEPTHVDLNSIVGGPTGKELPPDLAPLWQGTGGETYGATLSGGPWGTGGFYEVSVDGDIRPLHDFLSGIVRGQVAPTVSPELALNAILNALISPPSPTYFSKGKEVSIPGAASVTGEPTESRR